MASWRLKSVFGEFGESRHGAESGRMDHAAADSGAGCAGCRGAAAELRGRAGNELLKTPEKLEFFLILVMWSVDEF